MTWVLAALMFAGADSSSSLQAGGSWIFPTGGLEKALGPSPAFFLSLDCPYAGPLRAHVQLQGSYLEATNDGPVSVWSLLGGAGLGIKPASTWLPQAGLGFSLAWVREARRHRDPDRYLFLGDAESEFGFYPFAAWSIPVAGHWHLTLRGQWDFQFTEPEWSQLPVVQVGVGRVFGWAGPFQ